jgi:peptidoglycan L-alanyl-D-glutamate endopeptidase CwlK
MAIFSKYSLEKIRQCHPDLILVLDEAIKIYDFFIAEAWRGEEEQNKAYASGKSKKKYPYSKHNSLPSTAVDIYPYPFNFSDNSTLNISRCYYLAGIIYGISESLFREGLISHKVRWGGDWDSDNIYTDEKFRDMGHFELVTK